MITVHHVTFVLEMYNDMVGVGDSLVRTFFVIVTRVILRGMRVVCVENASEFFAELFFGQIKLVGRFYQLACLKQNDNKNESMNGKGILRAKR